MLTVLYDSFKSRTDARAIFQVNVPKSLYINAHIILLFFVYKAINNLQLLTLKYQEK